MGEHVILVAGPMGAGKTTAVTALSEIEVVNTEAVNSEAGLGLGGGHDKATTTVALDYGEIGLGSEDKVRLYGIPGQRRFAFMWTILAERAEGLLLLVNNDTEDPVGTAIALCADFERLYERGGIVLGITRTDLAPTPALEDYSAALSAAMPGWVVPVFSVDARDPDHLRLLLMTLVVNIEMRAMFGAEEVRA